MVYNWKNHVQKRELNSHKKLDEMRELIQSMSDLKPGLRSNKY